MATKVPPTWAERAQRIADGSRFYVDKANEFLEELDEVKSAAEAINDADVSDVVGTLRTILEQLAVLSEADVALSQDTLEALTGCVDDFEEALGNMELEQLVTNLEEAREGVDEVMQQRDDPSSYDADERRDTRENTQSAFGALADTLSDLEPAPDVVAVVATS